MTRDQRPALTTRAAELADASGMSAILTPILAGWGSTRSGDPETIRSRYLSPEHRVACTLAETDGRIVGFQSLKCAWPGNPYGVPPGWGIIGTYAAPDQARRGVGRALFAESKRAAAAAGLHWIDATIGAENEAGLAYYGRMGFETYRSGEGVICKRYRVS